MTPYVGTNTEPDWALCALLKGADRDAAQNKLHGDAPAFRPRRRRPHRRVARGSSRCRRGLLRPVRHLRAQDPPVRAGAGRGDPISCRRSSSAPSSASASCSTSIRCGAGLTTIARFAARAHIRRHARRKWLFLFSPDQTKQRHLEPPSSDARRALRETYKTLDTLPANERIAFVLRFIDGMTLPEAAAAAGVSLATLKRRLSRAEKKFLARARERPLLEQWLQEGTRWTLEKQS